MAKTYGEKPIIFSFEENGEQYMIGSEVENYLRGDLYKKYPGLARRNLTNHERRKLMEMGHSHHVTSGTISLLLANQVEDILNGRDDQFKGKETTTSIDPSATPARPKPAKPASIVPAMPNSSHLDAVPQATPINRNRVIHKKVRTFPLCFDDTDPPAVHENSAQTEILVPIRLDMDIEGENCPPGLVFSTLIFTHFQVRSCETLSSGTRTRDSSLLSSSPRFSATTSTSTLSTSSPPSRPPSSSRSRASPRSRTTC